MVDNTINNQNQNENDQNETKETSYMDLTFFNNTLQEFLKLDQEIKKLSKAVKIRRDKKNQLSEMILLFLKKNKISKIQLDGDYQGKQIHEKITTNVSGFNRENINEVLVNYFENNIEDYEKIIKKIEEKTVKKENSKLSLNNIKMTNKIKKDIQNKQIDNLLENA